MGKKRILVTLNPFPAHCLKELREKRKLSISRIVSEALIFYWKYFEEVQDAKTRDIEEVDKGLPSRMS